MKPSAIPIGFSQRIQLTWLEYTAGLVKAGKSRTEINAALQELLQDRLSVGHQVERGNREKAITILLKIWQCPPDELVALRDEGLDLLARLPSKHHVAIHWGMSIAVYPFFGAVTATVGRLLRLQQEMSTAQVQRRIREQLGERETVARAARRIYRSFIDWHVLVESGIKGTYSKAKPIAISDRVFCSWMAECLLQGSRSNWTPLEQLNSHPSCFPFEIQQITVDVLQGSPRLEVVRHGMDQDMVRACHAKGTATS